MEKYTLKYRNDSLSGPERSSASEARGFYWKAICKNEEQKTKRLETRDKEPQNN